jgi:hypothetical protein
VRLQLVRGRGRHGRQVPCPDLVGSSGPALARAAIAFRPELLERQWRVSSLGAMAHSNFWNDEVSKRFAVICQAKVVSSLEGQRIAVDEIRSFVGKKQMHLKPTTALSFLDTPGRGPP